MHHDDIARVFICVFILYHRSTGRARLVLPLPSPSGRKKGAHGAQLRTYRCPRPYLHLYTELSSPFLATEHTPQNFSNPAVALLPRPHGDEVPDAPVLIRAGLVRPRRLDEANAVQGAGVRLLGRGAVLGVAVVGVLDGLPGISEEGLIDFGPDAPRRALLREGLSGGELEADELAAGGEELGHALCPPGAL